jgi:hypothetical protein
VGIGTSSPSSRVDARTSGITVANFQSTNANGGYMTYVGGSTTYIGATLAFLGSGTSSDFGIVGTGANNMVFGTSSAEKMRIDSSGNLLVGTTSNIAANAKIFALGSGVGIAVGYATTSTAYRHLYMNSGDATLYFFNPTNYASLSPSGAWTNASDARLKKNIVDIKYGLADVLRLQPRSYQMNDVAGDFVGFVAQELQTVIPEVVTGDPEKQLGVDYGSLVAVAFKAIQEQQALIAQLQADVAALKGTQ